MEPWRALLLAPVLALALSTTGAHPRAAEWRVGLRGVGPVRYGMSLREASRALGERLQVQDPECDFLAPRVAPRGTQFMVVSNRIARVDIAEPSPVLTVSGAGIGTTEDEIRRLYPGRIRTEPHPYTGPEGHELVFVPAEARDSVYALVFETDGERVIQYRAGRRPMVRWIEGCS